MNADDLRAFEDGLAEEFNQAKIPFPVHFEEGNEKALISIFKGIREQDWVFGSWRMHLKALLKGVPPEELKAAIYRGESMALRFDEYRVYGSAIVGGTLPIALGAAMAIKRRGLDEHVWCFLGDMTSFTGIYTECWQYACGWKLPITFVIEDNGVSVCTPTNAVWGSGIWQGKYRRYEYESKWPHCGSGKRIEF